MPAHQVGSLDAWLGSPFANGGIGVPAIQFFQGQSTRSRSFLSGPSRHISMMERKPADTLPSMIDSRAGSEGQGGAVQLASTCAAMEVGDASLSPAITIDNVLDRACGYSLSPRMATSPKRKSLLSEQLRTASSLPMAAWRKPNPEDADYKYDGDVIMRACRSLGSGPTGNRDFEQRLGADSHSTSSSHGAPSTARWLSGETTPATCNDSSEAQESSPSAEAGSLALQRFQVGGGLSEGSRGGECGGGGPSAGDAASCFHNASYGSKLLVLGSMDADASSACGGGGSCSLACSSSAGCYSSGSNVLQYYSCRDRDDEHGGCGAGTSGESLVRLRSLPPSHPAVAAATAAASAAATGGDAAGGAARASQPAGSMGQREQQQQQSCGGLLEQPAARKPSSLPQLGTATDAPSLSTALSSPSPCGGGGAFPATPTSTIGITFAVASSKVGDGGLAADEDAAADNDQSDSHAVCSVTDLVFSPPGTTDSDAGCTVVQMAMAGHLISAPPDVAADTEAEPETDPLAAPPPPAPGPPSPLSPLLLPGLQVAGSPGGGSAAAAAGGAVAAQLLSGGDSSSGSSSSSDGALARCEQAQQAPAGDLDPPLSALPLRQPQLTLADVPQYQRPGNRAPGREREEERQLERHGSEGLPTGMEGSRRGGRAVPYASLFSTVLLLPAGSSSGSGGGAAATEHCRGDAAADPYNPSVCLQHSLSMGGGMAQRCGGARSGDSADGDSAGAGASDAWLRDLVNARRSFDVSKALSRAQAASGAGAGGSRGGSRGGSIHELLEADVAPAMYEGTVRRGLPRRAAPLARAMSQPVTEEMLRSCLLDSAEAIDAAAAGEDAALHD